MLIERDLRKPLGFPTLRSLQRPLGIPHHDIQEHWHADRHADYLWGEHAEHEQDRSATAPALVDPVGRSVIY